MHTRRLLQIGAAVLGAALGAAALSATAVSPTSARGRQPASDDIEGVGSGPTGPEAGVWVIAETTELPTRYSKTVVTDDRGRYVIPDLPRASYSVWVRGYGLVDSPKSTATPGRTLNL